MSLVTDAFEDLSHAFRVLLEADIRANRQGLLQLDRAEAVGNIETALASVMNAFHRPVGCAVVELSDGGGASGRDGQECGDRHSQSTCGDGRR